ncbi:hypothetical protein K6119_10775 [Paracrocinitomix mangrovi]|uniref:hypothetical protein n=1 Tax=Paracrocinitomix mangrovi TaxID=2862509 RepID=UPI001C8D037D|nr:hypothetical protein [Paracrocinitomix mangrovi]UKN00216.1 hypothetical protein K6119_10775 [Paracrocinitomix mangrovi]
MCSYVGHWENDSLKYESPCQKLIEFEGDIVHCKTFNNYNQETTDTIISSEYEFKNQVVYCNNDSLVVTHFSQDSLVFSSNYDETRSTVYKRVQAIESPNPKFDYHQLYEYKIATWTDSIEFWSENTLMFQNEQWARDGDPAMWYIAEYKSFKFLFINGPFQSNFEPLLITGVDSTGIKFKIFSLNVLDGKLEKLPELKPKTNFIGTWIEEETTDRLAFFHYLKKDSSFNYKDSIAELKFTSDSLYISQFDLKGNFKIESSVLKTHVRLELTENIPESVSAQWHVTNPTDSTLKVYTYINHYGTSGVATVWFKLKNGR